MNNKYIGSWEESEYEKIDLAYNKENLNILLNSKVENKSPYTDQQVCNWCDSYFMYPNLNVTDAYEDSIYDISAQYEMFLSDSFSLEKLQRLDFSKVKIPDSWYEEWMKQLNTGGI